MTVTLSRDVGVAVVTLDRPDALNALDRFTANELIDVTDALAADSSVRAVVVTGGGTRAFCAGADIAEMGTFAGPADFLAFIQLLQRATGAFAALAKPTIAAIEGVALGGGFELALACDFRVVGERARLGLPEIKLGLLPGLGGTQRAIRQLPGSVAMRLLMVGDPLDASTAHRHGLCEEPVPAGEALAAALELAHRLAAGPPLAMAAAKRLAREGIELELPAAIALEQTVVSELFGTADAAEGIAAFLAKRPADFTGS
jgi:enoyl-CoA hydratase/carnithine racemase